MDMFSIGQVVYAADDIVSSATSEHPRLVHASWRNKLYVIDIDRAISSKYCVSKNKRGTDSFWVTPRLLMGQRPFTHNRY